MAINPRWDLPRGPDAAAFGLTFLHSKNDAKLDLTCPGDELSGVVAVAVDLSVHRPLIALVGRSPVVGL